MGSVVVGIQNRGELYSGFRVWGVLHSGFIDSRIETLCPQNVMGSSVFRIGVSNKGHLTFLEGECILEYEN